MIQVSNNKCIRRLSRQSMKTSKVRNIIAILAIALTTVLFTSLFTIAMSMNEGIQQTNFRQAGGFSHGTFKYLTKEQYEILKADKTIKEYGLRRFLGGPTEAPFNKSQVEIGYSDANNAHWMYCDPVEGRLPKEGTNEAATDLHVLELLGVDPEIGREFTITFEVGGLPTTQTFTLCGWWEYDEVCVANHVLLPESRVNSVLEELGITENVDDGMTGLWNLDVMFENSMHIQQDMEQVLENHGFQTVSQSEGDNYIAIGVNWGYLSAQISQSADPAMILAIVALLLLIMLTGYLIIYNIFQISVSNDIRFYGLLKTIGTTPKQLKRILRNQALLLSLIGIPFGLILGWLIGVQLTPVIVARMEGIYDTVSVSPVIFVGAAVFSLFTVLLSCSRPGRLAAKVSPVEAVRYTENNRMSTKSRRNSKKVSLFSMAIANLGRSRSKTAVTIISMSLAVVLLTITVTFTNGFDMDKYISKSICTDYIVANAKYFQVNNGGYDKEHAVPQEVIDDVTAVGGIEQGGKIYGKSSWIEEFVTEDYYRAFLSDFVVEEMVEEYFSLMERNEEGLCATEVQLYGMEDYALSKLRVLEGDISKLSEPGGKYVAAVYWEDDYQNAIMDSNWAKLGDTVTLRYVEEYEYYNPDTGEIYKDSASLTENDSYNYRAKTYEEVDYEVAALVCVPNCLSYRYYGEDAFVLGAENFIQDTKTDSVMLYACDATEEGEAALESFLADYTENQNPEYAYESKASYATEFASFRSMFLLLGGALSFIVGIVGILNFFNAILTGIIARKREFATLQSIGMTGKQLKQMLVYEGLFYAIGAVAFSLLLIVVFRPLLSSLLEGMFWFFTYRFTIMPILIVLPIFVLLGCIVPLVVYHFVAKATIVERLREAES